MPRSLHHVKTCGFSLLIVTIGILAQPVRAVAGPMIAVGVNSGRIFVGEIDSRSNQEELWLRSDREGATLTRRIHWTSIRMAGDGRRTYSADELREMAQTESIESATSPAPTAETTPHELPAPLQWIPGTGELPLVLSPARIANSQVAFISIDAYVANWNQTVEVDGIVLHVFPTSSHGKVIPVDGTLDVQLVASVPPGWPQGRPFPLIGRWSLRVSREQFGPSGAVFHLPFQTKHPEFDLTVQPRGLIHARLNVPGNGSFEASQSTVRIRPYSPVRDQLQQTNGVRFFDLERVERFGPH